MIFALNNPSAADIIISTTTKSSSSIGTRNKRILIVDDEEDITYCFKIALECAGFIVDTFNDPIKSLFAYKIGVYDLLLLDIKMPRMGGFELYDKIKEIDDLCSQYVIDKTKFAENCVSRKNARWSNIRVFSFGLSFGLIH